MTHISYTAILEKEGSTYGAYFPDLPGCGTAADSLEEIALAAEEALATYLIYMHENAISFPSATPYEDVKETDADVNVIGKTLVSAKMPGAITRINITMDTALLDMFDHAAEKSGLNRSACFAVLAKKFIDQELGQQR